MSVDVPDDVDACHASGSAFRESSRRLTNPPISRLRVSPHRFLRGCVLMPATNFWMMNIYERWRTTANRGLEKRNNISIATRVLTFNWVGSGLAPKWRGCKKGTTNDSPKSRSENRIPNLGSRVALGAQSTEFELTLPDPMHEFDAGDRRCGLAEMLEAEHRTEPKLDGSMSCSIKLFKYFDDLILH
jgi:hypothetical protein